MEKGKRIFCFLIFLFLTLFFLPKVLATGISAYNPPHRITYAPNTSVIFEFGITASSTDVELSAGGLLAKYATLSKKIIKADDEDRRFTVTLNFPDENTFVEPGHHRVWVTFSQIIGKGGTLGTALVGSTYIEVDVAYPGKYVESRFIAGDVNSNETSDFVFDVRNFGRLDVYNVYGVVKTYDLDGNQIDAINTGNFPLLVDESKTIYARKLMEKHIAGKYLAKAALHWDSNATFFEDYFLVGKLRVDLLDYTKNFTPNSINEFKMLVKSMWNNEVKNFYAEIVVMHENQSVITSFKTATTNLEPWSQKNLSVFWDAPDLPLKTYNIKIKLYYDGKSLTYPGEITAVKLEAPSRINFIYVIIGVLVVIVLILVIDILYIAKRGRVKT